MTTTAPTLDRLLEPLAAAYERGYHHETAGDHSLPGCSWQSATVEGTCLPRGQGDDDTASAYFLGRADARASRPRRDPSALAPRAWGMTN
jgi:hypothetical protein